MHYRALRVLCLTAGLFALAALVLAADEPLAVENARYDAKNNLVTFDLVNQSDQLINAWEFEVRGVDALGAEVITGKRRDVVNGPAVSAPGRSSLIGPGERAPQSASLALRGDPSLHAVDIEVKLAVFADNSFHGSTESAELVFDARYAEAEILQEILSILDSQPSSRSGISQARVLLQELGEKLERKQEEEGRSVFIALQKSAVDTALSNVEVHLNGQVAGVSLLEGYSALRRDLHSSFSASAGAVPQTGQWR